MDINSDDDDLDRVWSDIRSNPGDEPSEPDKPDKPSPYTLNKRGLHHFARKNKISLDPKVIDDIFGPNKKKTWSSEAAAVNYMKYVQEAKEAAEEVARAALLEKRGKKLSDELVKRKFPDTGLNKPWITSSRGSGGGNKKRRTKRRTKKRRTKKRRTKKRRTKKR